MCLGKARRPSPPWEHDLTIGFGILGFSSRNFPGNVPCASILEQWALAGMLCWSKCYKQPSSPEELLAIVARSLLWMNWDAAKDASEVLCELILPKSPSSPQISGAPCRAVTHRRTLIGQCHGWNSLHCAAIPCWPRAPSMAPKATSLGSVGGGRAFPTF